jgi:hypothetical protein
MGEPTAATKLLDSLWRLGRREIVAAGGELQPALSARATASSQGAPSWIIRR